MTNPNASHTPTARESIGTTGPSVEHLYAASYPRMWAAAGPKCERVQHRTGGRISLYCARPAGHEAQGVNHLYDVHPMQQVGPIGDAARAARAAQNAARYGDAETRAAKLAELVNERDEAAAISRSYAEAVTALTGLWAPGDDELNAVEVTLRARLAAAIDRRKAAGAALVAFRDAIEGRDNKLAAMAIEATHVEVDHEFVPTRSGKCDVCGRNKRTTSHGFAPKPFSSTYRPVKASALLTGRSK